ncbi:orotidine 5'-phosphate decarboxylase [Bowdeniella nasicola]|uniref:Orotidine-5'-phosphate decarboxylase n=1 Tax=Bowdeniella nasicola TaxID=208480 RepID=A0A1Q5Q3N2_9ACTO|nr:orotidine-5'-phosphate decarboxylase [Bowdeniella nasicola]OKL54302.1 orotidine 5'-phosphate decarboxylase [Bowdeniella nasicola]
MGTKNAGARLTARMVTYGPLCVGIDPHPGLLDAWGLTRDADGLRAFSDICVRELDGAVAALKPQVAFFETYGAAGIAALEECIAFARAAGHFVITDAKRGDIGSTMAGYAAAYLAPGAPLESDALTLSPYLGFGSLAPAIDLALQHDKGLFVLALTSNPEGVGVQHARTSAGSVAGDILTQAHEVNARIMAGDGSACGPIGSVVGATVGSAPRDLGLDLAAFNGIHLAPGVGAQGAGGAECRDVFGSSAMLASVSRGVLGAGPGQLKATAERFVADLARA